MQKIGRVILCLLLIGTLVFDFNYSNSVYAQKNDESYVYLSDLWNTKHLLEKKSGWNDARALKVNENEPGKLISLLVGGEQVYFLNGIFAHATSTVIFDISEYTQKGFDVFSTYLGVDTYASSNGNGVKFTISLSKDNKNWDVKETTDVMRGITKAKQVSINIEGYNYIKLYATDLGSNSSDHSVYADPIIYDSKKYEPREKEVDFIKTLSEYDEEH